MMDQTRILLFFAAFAFGGVLGCPDQADVDRVNSLARDLSSLANNLPDFNYTDPAVVQDYKQVLNTLCTTYKSHLYTISQLVGACFEILQRAHDLQDVSLLDKSFTQLFLSFADVDEFCDCSPHLISAWIMERFEDLSTNIPNGAYGTLADAAAYCNSKVLSSVIADLSNGQTACRQLWRQAGLTSSRMISDISEFMNERCPGFDEKTFECAVSNSSDARFISCINNAGRTTVSDSGSLCDARCCGRRACVTEYIGAECGVSGRDLYIDAVNLQRRTEKYLISQSDCSNGDTSAAMTPVLATFGISLLLFIF